MTGGMLLIASQSAVAKWLTAHYAIGEILFYRGLWALLPVAVLAWHHGGLAALKARRPYADLLRGILNVAAAALVLTALRVMPLAVVLAVVFSSPLILTALSAPVLHETVGWHRWIAVAVGFAGVLLITKPGGASGVIVALPLVGAVLMALRDVLTRRIGGAESPIALVFYTMVVSIAAGAATLPFGTRWPPWEHWILFAVAGVLIGSARYWVIRAFQLAEAATIAPLRYLALIWAAVIGFFIWNDVPDIPAIAGMALVMASGIYIARYQSAHHPDEH